MFGYEKTSVMASKPASFVISFVVLVLLVTSIHSFAKEPEVKTTGEVTDKTAKKQQEPEVQKPEEVTANLAKTLAKKQFAAIMTIDSTGKIDVLAPNGEEIPPCGKVEGAAVTGECELKGEITNLNSGSIGIIKGSPSCMWINVGGELRKIHAGGDVDAQGKMYQPGWRKCHEQQASSPPHHY